jgi:hypothetical protein
VSRKPENTFIGGVHKHLPATVYAEKMANPYRGGTADCWYSGPSGDLWVEYKFIVVPAKTDTKILANCSRLQLEWLKGRHREGRNVAVVVGSAKGGVILRNLKWETPISRTDFVREMKTRAELAAWINTETG